MRILILHNTYQQKGGEDTVVSIEAELLRSSGHDVVVELVSNDLIKGPLEAMKAAVSASFNKIEAQRVATLVRTQKSEIVHIHNFFPLLSPLVHGAARAAGAAVVQTLHNYRLLCGGALFLRDGEVCELCLHGSRLNALSHRCYRQSFTASAAVVAMQETSWRRGVWRRDVDRFIALTDFGRKKFIQGGFDAKKVVTKPNFLSLNKAPVVSERPRKGALYVGRLSAEKGVHTMIEAWQGLSNLPLTIIGSGPEQAAMEDAAPNNVVFLGNLPHENVLDHMARAQMLVFPSLWYEGMPMTLVEAFASGLPVVASDIGAASEMVTKYVGCRFTPKDALSLRVAVQTMLQAGSSRMSKQARLTYEQFYSDKANLVLFEQIYQGALLNRMTQPL